ncbi:MAG: acylphosphatase [Arenimonas sp.]
MIRKQFTIMGKVQGVWFRASTRDHALALGLSGYASNLADGSVQVQAQGAVDALRQLEQWLQQGPPLAKVIRVESLIIKALESETGFQTL